MGGTFPPDTSGCDKGITKRRLPGIGSLIGNVFNTIKCAIHGVHTLKAHVKASEPDFPTIQGDLQALGSLAGNIDSNEKSSNQESRRSTESQLSDRTQDTSRSGQTQSSNQSTFPIPGRSISSATGRSRSSTYFSSTETESATSSDPCDILTTVSAGKIAKRVDHCGFLCASNLPKAPSSGR